MTASADSQADVTGTITVDGQAGDRNLPSAGQNAALTFTASTGQRIRGELSANTIQSVDVTITQPDGTSVGSTL